MVSTEECQLRFYDLPLCRLHVQEAGVGPPLIIVPATISECHDWIPLTCFMAHWFHVYFFELPGHGKSTPFNQPFSTDLVAETVEHFVSELGIERFSLMGFSFGGILTIKIYQRLNDRVDNVIMISPCLTHRAILLSRNQIRLVLAFNQIFKQCLVRKAFLRLLHNPRTVTLGFHFLQRIGRLESTIELRPKLLTISESTLEVLSCQVKEIMTIHFPDPAQRYITPCFFWMSVNDPVLDYKKTLGVVKAHFAHVEVVQSDIPYHQPPKPLTYEGLNREFYDTVGGFLARGVANISES
jgi:pimeloyl-ACP methyl ester carboxylesterase